MKPKLKLFNNGSKATKTDDGKRGNRVNWLVALCLLLFVGCGSSNATNLSANFSADASTREVRALDGMVFLGQAVPGARVEAKDSSARSLAVTTTDEGGYFHLEGLDNSMELTLVATLPDSSFELLSLVDPDDGKDFPVLGVPSTLIARYMQDHPEATWPMAEDWFNRLVGASTEQSWGSFLDESEEMPFSHLAFFDYAASRGGVAATVEELLSEDLRSDGPAEESPDPRFDMELGDLTANFAGLEPAYAVVANAMQTPERASFSGTDLTGRLLKNIGEGVAGSMLDAGFEWAWTWVVSSISQNEGPDIASLQSQIDALGGQVESLRSRLDQAQYQSAVDNLNQAILPLTTKQKQLSVLALNTRLTNEPKDAPNGLQNFLNDISTFQVTTSLLTLQNYMLGTDGQTNILSLTLAAKMSSLGVDQQSHFMNMPLRSQPILRDVLRTYDFYAGYQVMACQLIGELSHGANNPLAGTQFAVDEIAEAAISLKRQRSQLPQPLPSERVLVDLENGLMWYLDVIGPKSFEGAAAFAGNFRLDAGKMEYANWRLPNDNELMSLRRRGMSAYVAGETSPEEGVTVSGLGRLHFQWLDRLANSGQVWSAEIDPFGRRHGFLLNKLEESSRLDSYFDYNGAPRCSILVRSVGANLHTPYYLKFNSTPEPDPLQLAEAAGLGVPVSVKYVRVPDSAPNAPKYYFRAITDYAVPVGGGFHYGRAPNRQRFDLRAVRNSVNLSTDNNPSFVYESMSANIRILNLPERDGAYLWTTSGPPNSKEFVRARASILGYLEGGIFPAELSAERPMELSVHSPRALASIRIFPKNRRLKVGVTQAFTAAGAYSDGTMSDLTNQVDWSVTADDGTPVAGLRMSTSPPGILLMSSPALSTVTVKAQLRNSDKADQTKIQITN